MTFLDTLRAKGINFHRSTSDSNEIVICCPFCELRGQTEDRRFRLGINIWTKQGHCFNCEWKSKDALNEVSLALILEFEEATTGIDETDKAVSQVNVPALPEDYVPLSRAPKGVLYGRAKRYLSDRGIADWQIEDNKIGVSLCGKYAYRIILPVYDGKKLQGLVTRDFTGHQELKYLNTEGLKSLYGAPEKTRSKKVILCEGAFDRFSIERTVMPFGKGDYDVKAVLGRALTELQKEQLKQYRDVILWPDNDMPGVKGFLDIADQLKQEFRVFMIQPFGYDKDANGMEPSERRYVWSTRSKYDSNMELRMRTEVAFRE